MKWRALLIASAALLFAGGSSNAAAYSVLAHEALIDEAWSAQIAPLLARRFPRASKQDVEDARAFAYGGSLIQDLGYYPFGSRFFSNLVHYVRSGGFVAALIAESQTVDEYAFALGALSHYASDNAAHPIVNHTLPTVYPKLREKFSGDVLFGESPTRHVMAEFAFDVVQVARGKFKADAYQRLIGFEVARPLLERAFHVTYGLELKDVFGDVDLAIGTYRRAASQIIPDVTRIAWREKRDEIASITPDATERNFVYTMTRQEYEDAYGTGYRKPGFLVRMVVAIFKVVPKFGPLKPLAFEPLPPATERAFLDGFQASLDQYEQLLRSLRGGRLSLADTDLDTGRRPARGHNTLADETYADLIKKLEKAKYAGASPGLRGALGEHYAAVRAARSASRSTSSR
ncbi:MAG TPA: zinc dependent phospholipase C family protein [Vicinamibacterales bacterium]|nr:zinc dependent phospholipase C family protein [Vicinamibacterales bacterium]